MIRVRPRQSAFQWVGSKIKTPSSEKDERVSRGATFLRDKLSLSPRRSLTGAIRRAGRVLGAVLRACADAGFSAVYGSLGSQTSVTLLRRRGWMVYSTTCAGGQARLIPCTAAPARARLLPRPAASPARDAARHGATAGWFLLLSRWQATRSQTRRGFPSIASPSARP